MRKLFFCIIPLFFLFSISLALAGECTPPNGFDYCYQESYTYEDCTANAKIYFTTIQGVYKSGYYIKEAYVNVGYTGDKLYQYIPYPDEECDEDGCDGDVISAGKKVLATSGQEFAKSYAFLSWDKKSISGECTAWAYAMSGFDSTYKIKVVECYENADCASGQTCDKSGTWNQWRCTTQQQPTCGNTQCETGENSTNCCSDCGCPTGKTCTNNQCVTTINCGNNICESGETQTNCCRDCGCSVGYSCLNNLCTINSVCTNGEKQYHNCANGSQYIYANCVNNQWQVINYQIDPCAQCTNGQEKCTGQSLSTCMNNQWVNQGLVLGKCGYTQNQSNQTCNYYYWYDSTTSICGYKQFCGTFMYNGLRVFSSLSTCQNSLNQNQNQTACTILSCANQSHVLTCVGHWEVTGTNEPNCLCNWKCDNGTEPSGGYCLTFVSDLIDKVTKSGNCQTNTIIATVIIGLLVLVIIAK